MSMDKNETPFYEQKVKKIGSYLRTQIFNVTKNYDDGETAMFLSFARFIVAEEQDIAEIKDLKDPEDPSEIEDDQDD